MSGTSTGPLVSVCIPTYNRPAALAKVISSILAQTYRRVEIIVTDDGDAVETRRHLQPFDGLIRYHANERRLGIYGNWNRAIGLATGELVAVYHDHDDYAPTMVERSVQLFQEAPRVGIVHVAASVLLPDDTRLTIVHRDLPRVADGRWFAERQAWRWASYVAHGAMMVRRDLYEKLGVFDESKGLAADMDMLCRFCLMTDIGYVAEPLYGYSGRRVGDALFDFKWAHVIESANVRRSNLDRVYAGRPMMRLLASRAFQVQLDEMLLRQVMAARIHDHDDLVQEGLQLVKQHASPGAHRVASLLSSSSRPAGAARALSYRVYKWLKGSTRPFAASGNDRARASCA